MRAEKPTIHFTDPYLLAPNHPVVVHLIGSGGTGSHVLTALASINHCLLALGHPGLFVQVFDGDIVTAANEGRALFPHSEIGRNKAVVFVNRVNRFFGSNWKAIPQYYSHGSMADARTPQITISCVDSVATRFEIADILKKYSGHCRICYWLDFGNSRHSGQAILSTVGEIEQPKSKKYKTVKRLPFITEEYKELFLQSEAEDNSPSCSVAAALLQQDLFINSALANLGGRLLWGMFRDGMLSSRGFFLNLETFKSEPIKI